MTENPPTPAPPSPSRRAIFWSRLGTTIVLWGLITAGLILEWESLFGFPVIALAMLGVVECLGLFDLTRQRRFSTWTIVLSAAYLISTYAYSRAHPAPLRAQYTHLDVFFIVLHVLSLFTLTLLRPLEGRSTLDRVLGASMCFLYVAFLFNFVNRIIFLPASGGTFYALYLVLVTKFSDMGAYAIGSLMGKHKMIPHISPGKTWEGLAGAYLGSYVGGITLWVFFPERLSCFNLGHALILPGLLCTAAVTGDLAESAIKRCAGAKDSGHVLPGIGGVLDLIDSLLFTAPVMFLYMNLGFDLSPRP